MLYWLVITDTALSEDFAVGVFSTRAEAEKTALHYLANVRGFCEFPCTYRIEEKPVRGHPKGGGIDKIWLVQGWNSNENFDEADLVESPFLLTEEEAAAERRSMMRRHRRAEWAVDCWRVGVPCWTDGFVRV